MRKIRVPFFIFILVLIPALTILIIKLASGYSFDFSKKQFEPRGILVATSIPNGAQVFIDGELKTATDTTINVFPGSYLVEIKKDGYSSWTKELKIEKELVAKTDAFLFRTVPNLQPITFSGAQNPILSPDEDKIVFATNATDSAKSGLWLADLSEFPFGLARSPKQIVQNKLRGKDFSKAQITWSPDSRQILVNLNNQNFLLDPGQLTLEENLVDISWNLKSTKASWAEDENKVFQAKIKNLPDELEKILANSASNVNFSLDGEKITYEATASAQIPVGLVPPLPASSTQKEEREIKPGRIYVYDLKEDKNFLIAEAPQPEVPKAKNKNDLLKSNIKSPVSPISWFPTSRHLLWVEQGKISLVEYDGTNKTTIFSGPFEDSSVFPAPGANRIIILTSFGQEENQPPNLYSISLR